MKNIERKEKRDRETEENLKVRIFRKRVQKEQLYLVSSIREFNSNTPY